MLKLPKAKMPHLAYGLAESQLEAAARDSIVSGEAGLTVSTIGGAFGPTWPSSGKHSLDFLRHFRGLRHLSVYLPSLASLEPLEHVADTLETLSLAGFDKPSKLSLAPLEACQQLKALSLVRLPKDLDVVWRLPKLEQLALTGYRDKDLKPAKPLKTLRVLYLGFGGFESIELVKAMPNLAAIEILRTKGLADLSPLADLSDLQFIALGDLAQVKQFPSLRQLKKLRRVYLDTLNGLEDLSGLAEAPNLEEFILINSNAPAAAIVPLAKHRKLKRVLVGLSSRRATEEVDAAFGDRVAAIFGTEHEFFELR